MMAFTIRTDDGRTSLSTASAERAASYLLFLQNSGVKAAVIGINGRRFSLAALSAYAEGIRQVGS